MMYIKRWLVRHRFITVMCSSCHEAPADRIYRWTDGVWYVGQCGYCQWA